MNSTEIIKEVSKKTKIKEETVRVVFNSIFDTIKEKLLFGIDIKIKGFITFKLKTEKERIVSNFGEPKKIPKRYSIKCIISALLVEKIRNKTVY